MMRCIGCGCSTERACPGGCHWVSTRPPKCSACFDRNGDPIGSTVIIQGSADANVCPASQTGHDILWLTGRSGYCLACRAPVIAREIA